LNKSRTVELVQLINDYFGQALAEKLNLKKVKPPLVYRSMSGLSDNLLNKEATLRFNFSDFGKEQLELVRAVTKWKRSFIKELGFKTGEGIISEVVGVRPDEELSNIHSVYVDQWDWEIRIAEEQYNLDYLKSVVIKIYEVLVKTEKYIAEIEPGIKPVLPDDLLFIHSSALTSQNSQIRTEQLEYEFIKKNKAVFVIGIGGNSTDKYFADRSADYDDWITPSNSGLPGLNGDLLIWNPVLNMPLEISSLGIRVSKEILLKQVDLMQCHNILELPWHKKLLQNELPLTIGGGIGFSRTCMFLLRKAHIGEVQPGVWTDEMIAKCKENNVDLLQV